MRKHVLIVDDEPHMLRLIEASLKKGGYDVLFGRDGNEALALGRQAKPDLIIMDVTMPQMDGITALQHLKASPETASIPVIILTGRGQPVTRQLAEASGATAYLTKPFSPSQLLAEAREAIGPGDPPVPPTSNPVR